MSRLIKSLIVAIFISGCVEPYEFRVVNKQRGVAVEAYFSDRSFNETLSYPSDGRYFTVRLSYTSDVENTRSEKIHGARVEMIDHQGNTYVYEEGPATGVYFIRDPDFKAVAGVRYKLRIQLQGEGEIESNWQTLPEVSQPVGEVGFRESRRQVYKYEADERVIKTVDGVEPYVTVPENSSGLSVFYRWTIDPLHVYEAPFAPVISPFKRCWVKDSLYITNFVLREDQTGKYNQPLFFMETVRNYKIYYRFSALIRQEILTEDHFFFWKEMQERNQGGFTQDTPPYNLKTNFVVTSGDIGVYGYFAPVRENAIRWYFDRNDLSYLLEDTSAKDCSVPNVDRAPHCDNCLAWEMGRVTNEEPSWWEGE